MAGGNAASAATIPDMERWLSSDSIKALFAGSFVALVAFCLFDNGGELALALAKIALALAFLTALPFIAIFAYTGLLMLVLRLFKGRKP
ncbi:hypothetical protein LJR220_005210 [Bradyrhizobium sp. LjRoot220]|uniref:hypothetical protein n=1 Tax=Bradyrhizobium sp. LjRoot220 TaxID=3342284 RepID=UPI003ECFF52A